jgi:hypothetical protein
MRGYKFQAQGDAEWRKARYLSAELLKGRTDERLEIPDQNARSNTANH